MCFFYFFTIFSLFFYVFFIQKHGIFAQKNNNKKKKINKKNKKDEDLLNIQKAKSVSNNPKDSDFKFINHTGEYKSNEKYRTVFESTVNSTVKWVKTQTSNVNTQKDLFNVMKKHIAEEFQDNADREGYRRDIIDKKKGFQLSSNITSFS